MAEEKRGRRISRLWPAIWAGIFLIGMGILFLLGVDFLPGILILIGILILVGGIIKWYTGEEEKWEKT